MMATFQLNTWTNPAPSSRIDGFQEGTGIIHWNCREWFPRPQKPAHDDSVVLEQPNGATTSAELGSGQPDIDWFLHVDGPFVRSYVIEVKRAQYRF